MREWLYRVLLPFFPSEFQTRFGEEMLETARRLDQANPFGIFGAVRILTDIARTWWGVRRDMRRDARLAETIETRRGGGDSMDGLMQDIRFALRGLRRDRLFTAFVVATLALGIGANAAMFGIVDRLLLRGPEHVRDARRVVRFFLTNQPPGMRESTYDGFGNVSYDLFRREAHQFEAVAAYKVNDGVLGEGADARAISLGYGSETLFPLLGVRAELGRFFGADENLPGRAAHVAVVGYGAWQSWLGGGRDVIGRSVTIGNESYEVIGVAPRGFTGPELGRVDFWLPMNILGPRITAKWETSWNAQWLKIVGRLKPGVTFAQAGQDITLAHQRAYDGDDKSWAVARLSVASLGANEEGVEATEITVVRWLSGVAILVLLIACANVANLLLARGMRRAREVAVRAALGARKARLARLLLAESVILSVTGAAVGLVVAYALGGLARGAIFTSVEWSSSPVNARVLLISAGIAIATGVLVGLVPAWRASRTDLTDALKRGPREGQGHRSRMRNTLTVAQAALSVMLLIGAGLFVRSLWNVRTLHLGIDPDRVLVVNVSRPRLLQIADTAAREVERTRRRLFNEQALPVLERLAGVEAASAAAGLPFGNRFTVKLRVPGLSTVPQLKSGKPGVSAVAPEYFATVGTRILRGRGFNPGDRAGSEPVAIVSDLMAKTVWPGRDPIGTCIISGEQADPPCARIVGIAEDTHRDALREDPSMHYYIPLGQEVGFGGTELLVRTTGEVSSLGLAITRALVHLDPTIRYVDIETIQHRIDPQTKPWQLGATVFSFSGLLALLVAALGVYSVMSYLVADRTHEIGVRVALGARRADITQLVLGGSLLLALVGVTIGCIGAWSVSRLVEPLLFNESARDPWVYSGVTAILLMVAFIAGLIPSLRANRIDPLEALRAE
jgi:putative ABC transport system permease protein